MLNITKIIWTVDVVAALYDFSFALKELIS
jgi:hypothetical protein